jgi:hypothetical protein
MILLGILVFIAVAAPAVALAKRVNRPVRHGGQGRGSPSRPGGGKPTGSGRPAGRSGGRAAGGYQRTQGGPSWVIKAWNASGAPKTSETTLKGAAAVVTGKAAGKAARGGVWASRRFGRGGVWFANTALRPFDRWLERTRVGLERAAADGQEPERWPADDVSEDVIHDAEPSAATRDRERELNEFKLATKEKWLKDMVASYEGLCAEGLIGPEAAAEHMISRGRLEYEIEQLRRALNRNPQPAPAASPPPTHGNPFRSNKGGPVSVDTPTDFDRTAVPPTLAAHLNHIAELHPENDAEILNFLKTEVTGMLAYAEAVNTFFEHCVTGEGLDPAAMQGVSDYAEAFAENASAAANGHRQFLAVYEAIIEAANNGTVMPYNGRFFSGESAA